MTAEVGRKRPPDRSQQILVAASELFAEVGFAEATVSRIADLVGITPGALYRHYAGKEDLLAAILLAYSDRILLPPTAGFSLEEIVTQRAHQVVQIPLMGVLWSREVRHLSDERRQPIVQRIREANELFADAITSDRPDLAPADAELLSWAMLSVLLSTSSRLRGMDDAELADVLGAACLAIAQVELSPRESVRRAVSPLRFASTRENLIAEAGRLLGERGYQTTSLAEIGKGAGVTGPGIYSYFDSKEELLAVAIERAYHAVWLDLQKILARSQTPAEALDRLVASYVRVTHESPHLVAGLIAAPGGSGADLRRRQHEFVGEWDALLQLVRPGISPGRAHVLVRAAMVMVSNLSRTRALAGRPDLAADLCVVAGAVLQTSVT